MEKGRGFRVKGKGVEKKIREGRNEKKEEVVWGKGRNSE